MTEMEELYELVDGKIHSIHDEIPRIRSVSTDGVRDMEHYFEITENVSYYVEVFLHGDKTQAYPAYYYSRWENERQVVCKWVCEREKDCFVDVTSDDT